MKLAEGVALAAGAGALLLVAYQAGKGSAPKAAALTLPPGAAALGGTVAGAAEYGLGSELASDTVDAALVAL